MKRPFFVVILAILLAGLVLFGRSGAAISFADTGTPNNEITSNTSNSSASATIMIAWTTASDEGD